MHEGSCCCGAVRFRIADTPKMAGACHCSRCRKLGATPFAFVARAGFELLEGRDAIVVYEPEPGFRYRRCFCGRCGTSLGEILSEEETFPIPLDCFDADPGVAVRFHVHVAMKPSWEVIPEGVKQFDGDPA